MPKTGPQHSFDNFGLHHAALVGDDEGVRHALAQGADVNALDGLGRTVIMCAVAGERWDDINISHEALLTEARLNTIRLLLSRPEISLFTLNAPQDAFRGVTPIGVAAWMNLHDVVELLLKGSLYAVSVDGMDTHGATSLMYAARDGNLRVVQLLLRHGARPDFRDRNHRTSIQFSLSHSRVLYLCEEVLRRHRWREAKTASRSKLLPDSAPVFELPPGHELAEPSFPSTINASLSAKLTRSIIRAVTSSDMSTLHSLLSPLFLQSNSHTSHCLVNAPDVKGWSPIHHCAAARSPSLDILNALYYAGADVSLFTTHEHFTPLHCLARSSYIFQDDDRVSSLFEFISRLVREFRTPLAARDKEDETCIHIAAEHGSCINLLMILLDHDEHGQIRELRNSRGLTALEIAKPEFRVAFGEDAEKLRSASSLSTHTIRPITSFSSLASFSECRPAAHEADVAFDFDVSTAAHQIVTNLRLTALSVRHHDMDLSDCVHFDAVLVEVEQLSLGLMAHFRGRTEDTSRELLDLTATSSGLMKLLEVVSRDADVVIDARGIEAINPRKFKRGSEDSQKTVVSMSSHSSLSSYSAKEPPSPSVTSFLDGSDTPKKKSAEEKGSSPSKWKTWFKRKAPSDRPISADSAASYASDSAPRTPEKLTPPPSPCFTPSWSGSSIDNALKTSQLVLSIGQRDLQRIEERITIGQQLVLKTNQAISRAERIIHRAVKKRRAMISDLRKGLSERKRKPAARSNAGSPDSLGYEHFLSTALSTRNSNASLASNASSARSLSETILENDNDDDETRAIRRLLLRKIEATLGGALDEIDMAVGWLRIVKEVVRGVKRRAYL
ncbi:ankyrin [Hymenopellis radicata]|nr:ankyrin [Hymenopellis radicata]